MQHLEIFPWSPNFETHITEIDDQHKKIVELLNYLVSHLAYHTEIPDLKKVFEELKDYAVYHFNTEESLWEKYIGDELSYEHKEQHIKFIEYINTFSRKNLDLNFRTTLEEVIRFLTRWLGYHIIESDRHCALIVSTVLEGKTLEEAKLFAAEEVRRTSSTLIETIIGMYDKLADNTIQIAREMNKRAIAEALLLQAKNIAETKVSALTSLYRATSEVNKAIMRATTEDELLQTCCELCVSEGKMMMAWIGAEKPDLQVIPVASSGFGREYLDDIHISSDVNNKFAHGPSGTSLRLEKPIICQDFENDPMTAIWRETGKKYGWKSCACFPLLKTQQRLCLSMYSDQPNFFTETILNVLEDLIRDIAYGIEKIRHLETIKAMESNLAYLADHDSLTGLLNRRSFLTKFQDSLSSLDENEFLALFFIDLEHLKGINDSFGHFFGDSVLKGIALRLETITNNHLICRQDGDEFLVAYRANDRRSIINKVENILKSIARPITVGDKTVQVNACIGVDFFVEGVSFEELLKNSDIAMYEAKKARLSYQVFDEKMKRDQILRLQIEGYLRHSIENKELYMVLQPQIDLTTGKIVGAESLLRWKNKELGNIPPGLFIPYAENSGIIVTIGDWIINTIFSFMESFSVSTEISINLSVSQFKQGMAKAIIQKAQSKRLLAPIRFEITESAMINDLVIKEMSELNSYGYTISIDDFGTGYSNLGHLKELCVDELKIDKSFIDNLETDVHSRTIVAAIIDMCKALSLTTLAEGVETEEQANILRELGCDKVQGYLYYKPMSLDSFIDLKL